ncbi:MAG: hypothetical protein LBR27_05690 [Bifidobacteriaceae bacterium]|jgi:hypothetical protein|nr:hypothetical protein [Bifidobacteriaceae bacterium]
MRKSRFAIAVTAAATTVALAVSPALAAQTQAEIDANVATRAALGTIVGPQVDAAYNNIKATVTTTVSNTVKGAIGNSQAIKDTVKPLLKEAIKTQLASINISDPQIDTVVDQAVDAVVDNQYVDAVLTNEFVQAVLNRAVDYAVADIVNQLGIDADKEQVKEDLINQVWNAPLQTVGTATTKVKGNVAPTYVSGVGINTSYYNYNVTKWNTATTCIGLKIGSKCYGVTTTGNTTPSEITVTGWNTSTINVLVQATTGLGAASQLSVYQQRLGQIDYLSVLGNALWKGLQDEVMFRINTLLQQAKTMVLTELTDALAQYGVTVSLDPTETWEEIGQDLLAGIGTWSQAQLDALVATLQYNCAH